MKGFLVLYSGDKYFPRYNEFQTIIFIIYGYLLKVTYYQVWTYSMPHLKAEACSNLNHDEHNDIHIENINDVYVTDYNYNWQNIQNL